MRNSVKHVDYMLITISADVLNIYTKHKETGTYNTYNNKF